MSATIPSRKILRIIGLPLVSLVLLCFLLGTTAYFLRHTLALLLAAPYLSAYGIELYSIAGMKIRHDEITILNIKFQTRTATVPADEIESEITNAKITFAFSELLRGHVQTVTAESISLQGVPVITSESALESTQHAGTAWQLKTAVTTLRELPLNSIAIDRFSLDPYFSDASVELTRDSKEVRGSISTSDFNFQVQANWHDEAYVSSHFIADAQTHIHMFPGDALTGGVRLLVDDELTATADFSLTAVDDLLTMDGTGKLQLSSLVPFLQRHELASSKLDNLEGTLEFSATAKERRTTGGSQYLDFQFNLSEGSHASGSIPGYPDAVATTFSWRAEHPLSLFGGYEPQSSLFNLNAQNQQLVVALQQQGEERQLTLELASMTMQCGPASGCTATQASTLKLPYLTGKDVRIEGIYAVTSAAIDSGDSSFTLALAQGSRIAADSITLDGVTLNEVNILVQQEIALGVSAVGDLHANSNGLELYLPTINIDGNRAHAVLEVSNLIANWPASSAPSLSAQVSMRNLGTDLLPVIPKKPEIASTLAFNNNALNLDATMHLADRTVLQLSAAHSITTGVGEAKVEVSSLQFGADQLSLSNMFFTWPFEADLVAGSLRAQGELNWHQTDTGQILVSGPLSITTEALSGYFEETAIVAMSTTLSGVLTDGQFISDDDLPMRIGSIDPGLPIENITFNYAVNTEAASLKIANLQTTMFNGTLRSPGLNYQRREPVNVFTLELDRIDLSRMLAMSAYEAVDATGLVSGTLPVSIAANKVSVNGGMLGVEAPGGSIRYQSPVAGNSGNAALDLVNQALSNYQYHTMDIDVDYLSSGELNLAVKLEGNNPDMNQGQAINVNLNVSDNIPALLRSLQASRDITEALQRELDAR